MSHLSFADVKKVARLSGIHLSDLEVDSYRRQFDEIIGYVELLDTADTEGLEPTYQVIDLKNSTRPDEIIDYGVSRDVLLENALDRQNGMIKVDRVL